MSKGTRQKAGWHEFKGARGGVGGKKPDHVRLEGCVEEPGLSLKGTREPWRSSEQVKDRVSLVL